MLFLYTFYFPSPLQFSFEDIFLDYINPFLPHVSILIFHVLLIERSGFVNLQNKEMWNRKAWINMTSCLFSMDSIEHRQIEHDQGVPAGDREASNASLQVVFFFFRSEAVLAFYVGL